MTLYRANAYRLQRLDTPADDRQPEVTVFFECDDPQAQDTSIVSARLLRLLAFTWNCAAPEVEFYNLTTEAELLDGGFGAPVDFPACPICRGGEGPLGDAALLVNGWYNGPLFCSPERTLMLVGPRTLARLAVARTLAQRVQQRRLYVDNIRAGATTSGVAARAAYESVQAMGGH